MIVSVLAIGSLRHFYGPLAGAILILPVIVAAWRFGFWGGMGLLLADCLLQVVVAGAFWSTASFDSAIVMEKLVTLVVSAVAAILVGRMREDHRKNEKTILERAELSREQRTYIDFMAMLNEIVRDSLEAEDMLSLLEMLAKRVGELFGVEDCLITRWDEARQLPLPTVAYGSLHESYASLRVFVDEPNLTRSVLDARRPLAIEDVRATPFVGPSVARLFPSIAVLGLPLIAGERRLGAVILGFQEGYRFSDDEIARGELAARQISLAIMKVLLLEEARQRVRELAGLHMISQTFTLSSDDRQVFGLLTEILAGLMEAGLCAIGLVDESRSVVRIRVPGFGIRDDILQAIQYPYEMGRRAWNFENGLLRANTQEEIPEEFVGLARSLGVESLLAAPLWNFDRKMVGAIYAANKEDGFTEDDARLMEIFASQVAVVIQNTDLLASERRRTRELAVLHAIAVAATDAVDEDDLLERASELIGEGLGMEYFAIFLLDDQKQELYLHSSYRLLPRETLIRIPLGIGVTGSVACSGVLRYVPDVSLAPDYLSLDPLVQSELCVPLKVEEKVIGVLNAERHALNGFTRQDQELLGILAAQVSTAIQRLRAARAERYQTALIERSNAMIKALVQVGAQAAAKSDSEGIFQTLGSELSRLGLTCVVALSNREQTGVNIRYTSLASPAVRLVERITGKKVIDYAIPNELLAPFAEHGQHATFVMDPAAAAGQVLPLLPRKIVTRILQGLGIVSNVVVGHVPLVSEGETIGILWLWGEGLREGDLPALSIFARQVAAAIQNAKLLAEVSRLAITDDLTGIFNRRHFFDLAGREFVQAQRHGQPLAVLIMDVDFFKKYNDQYGHQVGDEVLHGVAQRLQASLRGSDILGRYGGEEFAILLPQTDIESAMEVAERLHESVAGEPIQTQAGLLFVQLSIGVSGLQADTISLHALINRADQAMYAAKDAGRNRVALK